MAAARLQLGVDLVDVTCFALESIWGKGYTRSYAYANEWRRCLHSILTEAQISGSVLHLALYHLNKAKHAIRYRVHSARLASLRLELGGYEGLGPVVFSDLMRRIHHPLASSRITLIVALILARKWHEDHAMSNKTWSRITGLPLRDINLGERAFLQALDYRLHVRPDDYEHWTARIRDLARWLSRSRRMAILQAV